MNESSTVSLISEIWSANPPISSYDTSGFSMISDVITSGSQESGKISITERVSWFSATLVPETSFEASILGFMVTKKTVPLELLTIAPSSVRSWRCPIIMGGALRLRISSSSLLALFLICVTSLSRSNLSVSNCCAVSDNSLISFCRFDTVGCGAVSSDLLLSEPEVMDSGGGI